MKSLRQILKLLAFTGAIFVLMSSQAFGLTADESQDVQYDAEYYNSLAESCAVGDASTGNTNTLASGSSVYILGDSITERTQAVYTSTFSALGITANIDAQVGRSLVSPGTASENPGVANLTTGLQAITNDTTEITQAKAIVIALGTNGGDTTQSITQALAGIKRDNATAPIYWVDTIAVGRTASPGETAWDQSEVGPNNVAIYTNSANNYSVISWYLMVDPSGNPQSPNGAETDANGYIDNSDGLGVHPTAGGETALANLVSQTLTGKAAPSSGSTSGGSGQCACSSAGSATVAAVIDGQNVKDAFLFFTANGYSAAQSAGIVGNLDYESGVDPTKQEDDGTSDGGYGIAQFTATQLTDMRAWVSAKGEDPNSLQGQLDYLLYYLDSGGIEADLKATTTPTAAADAFLTDYEKPKDPAASEGAREGDATQIYNQYSSLAPTTTTASATSSTDTSACGGSTSPDCPTTTTGDALILCTAEQYAGNYYLWGGGHDGYAKFRAGCPITDIAMWDKKSTAAAVGPCATDCSGLVSMSVDQAFNLTYDWTVAGTMNGAGSNYWQPIPITSVQAGDIVTTSEHVEIVDHYDASTHTLYTFGSHYTGTQTGPVSAGLGYYTGAYEWTGPGSGTATT